MKYPKHSLIVVCMVLVPFMISALTFTQTDWHDGSASGDTKTGFSSSANTDYTYQWGRLSLEPVTTSNLEPRKHHIADMSSVWDKKLEVADMDSDGDVDVIVAGSKVVKWYENNGKGVFTATHLIYQTSNGGFLGYDLADFNFDGAMDVVVNNHQTGNILILINDDTGKFSDSFLAGHSDYGHQVAAIDLDGDEDLDLITTGHHSDPGTDAYWFRCEDDLSFTRFHIGDDGNGSARRLNTGDLDGDGDSDFTASAQHGTLWFENRIAEDGPEPGFVSHVVNTNDNRYDWIDDLDHDDDLDLITVGLYSYTTWWKNDGSGEFADHPLPDGGVHPEGVVSIDINYDGDKDIIQAFWNYGAEGSLGWFKNVGRENFDYKERHFVAYPYACDLQVADIDGNGLVDLVTSTHNPGDGIHWWDLFDHFKTQGELVSNVFKPDSYARWEEISWDEELPRGTDIKILVRTGNSTLEWPDWSSCDTMYQPGSLLDVVDQNTAYLQYKVIFTSSDPQRSPILNEILISYTKMGTYTGIVETELEFSLPSGLIRNGAVVGVAGELSIFDPSGRLISSQMVTETSTLDIDDLPSGLYFLNLKHAHGTALSKIIVQR